VVARGGTRSGAPGLVGRLVRLLDLGDGPVVYHPRRRIVYMYIYIYARRLYSEHMLRCSGCCVEPPTPMHVVVEPHFY
jgi:hypothetical protein